MKSLKSFGDEGLKRLGAKFGTNADGAKEKEAPMFANLIAWC